MKKDIHDYSDIIYKSRPVSLHEKMPIEDRAAQFMSFSALKGHKSAIEEKVRLTDDRVELDDNQKEIINIELLNIKNQINYRIPLVKCIVFEKDNFKSGGKYIERVEKIKNVDTYLNRLILFNGEYIDFRDIYEIEIQS